MTDWRHHDLRRTVATRMADLGIEPHVIEAILNHVSGTKAGVAGVYNRSLYAAEKRAALLVWADHVQAVWTAIASKNRACSSVGEHIGGADHSHQLCPRSDHAMDAWESLGIPALPAARSLPSPFVPVNRLQNVTPIPAPITFWTWAHHSL